MENGTGSWISLGENGKGIKWYRKEIFIPEPLPRFRTLALYNIAAVNACELYWDGHITERNGRPADNREDEEAGISGHIFTIPKELTKPGNHVLALRVSNHQTVSGTIHEPLKIGFLSNIQESFFYTQSLSLFLAGIFFLTAVFHIAILFGRANKWTYTLFCILCISCSAHILIQNTLRYYHLPLNRYYILAGINDIPWYFMTILLPIFFLFEFKIPARKRITTIIALTGFVGVLLPRLSTVNILPSEQLTFFNNLSSMIFYASLFISGVISVSALMKKRIGSLSATTGILFFGAGVYLSNRTGLPNAWATGFAVLILFLTVSLSSRLAIATRIYRKLLQKSARLESELIKKHIQPHFLLNTLNSIVAWLEENPKRAESLVYSLSDELRMLLSFSKKRLVSLEEEISLCRAHLSIINLRMERNYSIHCDCISAGMQIPPLIIHTLVENGITHAFKEKEEGFFEISSYETDEEMGIRVFNNGDIDTENRNIRKGTGYSYIETRLEETWPSGWELKGEPAGDGWEVNIRINKKNIKPGKPESFSDSLLFFREEM